MKEQRIAEVTILLNKMFLFSSLLVAVLLLAPAGGAWIAEPAGSNVNIYNSSADSAVFSDLDPAYWWAAQAIREMAGRNIIIGVGNKRFDPASAITRAQFVKILVLALDKPVEETDEQHYADVGPEDWSHLYVEAAKPYFSGFTYGDKVLFQPNLPAVREHMAVAIVKACGLEPARDLSVLEYYVDKDMISEDLRPYVAAVVTAGLMKGYEDGRFIPEGSLSRAEAAVLMYRVLQFKN